MNQRDMSCLAKAYIFVYFKKWQISASRFLNHLVLTRWFLLYKKSGNYRQVIDPKTHVKLPWYLVVSAKGSRN